MFAARFTTVSLEVKNRLGYGRWLPVKTDCEVKNPTRDPLIGQHDLGDKVRTTDLMDAVITNSSPSEVSPSWFKAQDLVDEFRAKGCVHTTFHHNNDANKDEMVICNCCTDCCLLYEGYQNGANPPSRKKLR